jgi:hypothetical protein
MDEKTIEFLARIDRAIEVAKLSRDRLPDGAAEWLFENYGLLIKNLTDIKQQASEGRKMRVSLGQLEPGTGLGMGMWLGEWCENDEVLGACSAVENYFRYEF